MMEKFQMKTTLIFSSIFYIQVYRPSACVNNTAQSKNSVTRATFIPIGYGVYTVHHQNSSIFLWVKAMNYYENRLAFYYNHHLL